MVDRKDCIDDILKAVGGRMNRRQVEDHLEEILDRAESSRTYGDNPREALGKAAMEMLEEEAVRSAILRRNMRMDAIKDIARHQFYDTARTTLEKEGEGVKAARLAAEARLVGINRPLFDPKSRMGNQDSVGALALGTKVDWVGGVINDLRRIGRDEPKFSGLERIFLSRKIEDKIFLEKYELDLGERGKAGVTKDEQALRIAKVLHDWDKVRVDSLNSEGAWISNYAGWVTRTSFDPDKIRKASNQRAFRAGFTEEDRLAWVADTLGWIDAKKTFGGQEADQALAKMYGGMIDGSYMQPAMMLQAEPVFPNVARKVSASRDLHWKDGQSWLANNKKYGRFGATDAWLHTMSSAADQYALMKVYGSKPKEGFETDLQYLQNKTMGTAERVELDRWEKALRNRFAVISGESSIPIASIWSGIINGAMSVIRMSKLGLTPFAMMQDNATISRELSRQGLGFFERHASALTDYFQGGIDSEKRQVAELLHTGIMERLQGATARWDVADAKSGLLAKAENTFFKITGIASMTANKRAGAERMMAKHFGDLYGRPFDEVGPQERQIMGMFGIGDHEWNLLNKVEWNQIEGTRYFTPDIAEKLTDADVEAYMKGRGPMGMHNAAVMSDSVGDYVRRDLGMKLWAYFAERGNYAVIEVGPKERAMLYQGTQPGEPLNHALRLLFQFKQFPTAMVTRAWGADVHGLKGMDRVTGLVELAVASTVYGMMANYLNGIVKGQDPNSQWRNQPAQALISGFVRGGAASIYGDFLMGEWSRFGLSAAATLMGPSLGQVDRVAELWSDLTHIKEGKKTGALATRMVRENLPYTNMIYTKLLVDYLIYYRLQEWFNPGYLDRMERTLKDKQGTEFWLKPSQPLLPQISKKLGG